MLTVETDLCPSCIQPVFNSSDSTSFAYVDYTDSDDLVSFNYVGASLVGYNVTDYISLSESSSIGVSDFPFLAVAV
jgi:hypothetical protein